jgi:hypothetical protein
MDGIMLRSVSLGASLVTGAGVAGAADLGIPVKAPLAYQAPPSYVFDWTGFYIGAHGGGRMPPLLIRMLPLSRSDRRARH